MQERARLAEAMRAAAAYRPDPDQASVVLALPFEGSWLAANTPARRVPSHGTHFLGQTFAIDFAAVDHRRRTAAVRDWRTLLSTEPVTRFFAFDRPILSPIDGQVVVAHDGEPDHPARRSPLLILVYLLTQGSRLRRGLGAVLGNHLILALEDHGPYVLLAHLRAGSLRMRPGDPVTVGQVVAACGNSGNATQPHLHVQVMDSPDLLAARGLPLASVPGFPRLAEGSRRAPADQRGHTRTAGASRTAAQRSASLSGRQGVADPTVSLGIAQPPRGWLISCLKQIPE